MDEKHLDKDAAYKMFAAFLSGTSAAIELAPEICTRR